jgi:hypothetical protein
MFRYIFALIIPLLAGPLSAAIISESVGAGPSTSTIVVDFGPESFAFEVHYNDSITGLDALRLLDEQSSFRLETVHFSFGDLVSGLAYDEWYEAGIGNNVDDWWRYWRSLDGATWTASGAGAGTRLLTNAAWDGWTWVRGQRTPPDTPVPEPSLLALVPISLLFSRRR